MPTEDELREQFHDPNHGNERMTGSIDLESVLRRSRARRRPRVVAVTVLSSLAAIAIVVPVSVSFALGGAGSISASSGSFATGGRSQEQSAADQGSAGSPKSPLLSTSGPAVDGGAPAQKVNLCTGTLADLAPATDGLVVTVQPVSAAATDRDIPATITLTNTSADAFSGITSPFPTLTLSRGGIVLWHSNGALPAIAQAIELAPGASTTFAGTFEPVVCGVPDDERGSFREDLPAAGPGDYELSAVLDLSSDTGEAVRASGPATSVTLR